MVPSSNPCLESVNPLLHLGPASSGRFSPLRGLNLSSQNTALSFAPNARFCPSQALSSP